MILDGVTIRPGDYIFGDIDGVIVIPKEVAEEVIRQAAETVEKENEVRTRLLNGSTLQKAYEEIGAI